MSNPRYLCVLDFEATCDKFAPVRPQVCVGGGKAILIRGAGSSCRVRQQMALANACTQTRMPAI